MRDDEHGRAVDDRLQAKLRDGDIFFAHRLAERANVLQRTPDLLPLRGGEGLLVHGEYGAKMRIDDAKADVGDAKLTQKPLFVVAVDVGELLLEQRPLPIDEPQDLKKKGVLVLEVLIGRSTGRAAG